MTLTASLKKNEGFVYQNLSDRRRKIEPQIKIRELVGTADLTRTFLQSDTSNSG